MKTNFILNCEEIIERIVNKDLQLAENTIKELYNEYSVVNMIQAIKCISKELKRLELINDPEYIKAFNRLKEILKNIESLKNVYSFNNNEVATNSVLMVLNKMNYRNKHYTFSYGKDKIYLSINNISELGSLRLEQNYNDVWNSKENDILITKDSHDNIYQFQFINNKYELIIAYSLGNKGLLKGINYLNVYGICKVA
jgi:hypothetical protein